MMLSSGTDTQPVQEANAKALGFGPERTPVKIVTADAYDSTGQRWVAPLAQSVPLTLTYPDASGHGIIDGINLRAKTLAVWWLDEAQNIWVKQWGASVNTSARTVTYPASHFSVYSLFASIDTDVTDAYAYPVPFRPNDGNPARYGSWATGISFVNLPSDGTIKIYTLSGQLVRSLGISSPLMTWDVRNSDGQQVASGLYIWDVVSHNNKRKTGKLIVIK